MSILRTSQVTALTGLSRTTLWRLEKAGAFPARVQLGANSIGWRADEVKAWIEARPRGVSQKPLSSSNGSDADLVTGRQS